ncbi:hypothetical protein [Kitasatospora sp. NPDC051914]|uniref:hypothetical protein n=1 Tax=Kitasatospora sp. NPDC051914 TaxID=3154945 RepID=UPI003444F66E
MTDDTLQIPRVVAARPAEGAPVFVDTSGRRLRRARRAGWLLAVPAAGYLALLASSLVGGPTLDAPFLPALPAHTATPAATVPAVPAPDRTETGGAAADPARADRTASAATRTAGTTTGTRAPATPTAAPTTATPAPTGTGHGRSTAQPSRKPTKTP